MVELHLESRRQRLDDHVGDSPRHLAGARREIAVEVFAEGAADLGHRPAHGQAQLGLDGLDELAGRLTALAADHGDRALDHPVDELLGLLFAEAPPHPLDRGLGHALGKQGQRVVAEQRLAHRLPDRPWSAGDAFGDPLHRTAARLVGDLTHVALATGAASEHGRRDEHERGTRGVSFH